MWQFLRTVLNNKRIADSVKEVDLRNWILGLVQNRGPLKLVDEDLELIEGSFAKLEKADPRPLVALILGSLPNLTTLSGQLPKCVDELFMKMVFKGRKGTQGKQESSDDVPLGQLRDVNLASTWVYDEQPEYEYDEDEDEEDYDREPREAYS